MAEPPLLDPHSLPQPPPEPPRPPMLGDDRALLVLACGLAGSVVPLVSLVAVLLSHRVIREARATRQPVNPQFHWGWILGMFFSALQLLILALILGLSVLFGLLWLLSHIV